jgi:5-formyltetrahydrofolate cyclo-ligase
MTDKDTFRKLIADKTSALSEEYFARSDEGIYERVVTLPEFIAARRILFYYSIGREPDTHALIEFALSLGKIAALPVSLPGGIMTARVVSDISELRVRSLKIPAPEDDSEELPPDEIDLIVVPAVAFDRNGYRCGRGGGYYDRYLPLSSAFTVGLCRAALLSDGVPRQAHDVSVKCVVTESGVLRL